MTIMKIHVFVTGAGGRTGKLFPVMNVHICSPCWLLAGNSVRILRAIMLEHVVPLSGELYDMVPAANSGVQGGSGRLRIGWKQSAAAPTLFWYYRKAGASEAQRAPRV